MNNWIGAGEHDFAFAVRQHRIGQDGDSLRIRRQPFVRVIEKAGRCRC